MAYKGKFTPKYSNKYKGNPNNIIYRSLWELKLMMYLDKHPQIIEWASEEFHIPYLHPVDKRLHRYFPDFWIKKKTDQGTKVIVVEVKPSIQTKEPTKGKKRKSTQINEAITFAVNTAKWKAAQEWCADRGWEFMIMTEKELGIT
jgi:hypothetical protein